MRVTPAFVKTYDKIFAIILEKYGLDDLISFWKEIAPVVLADLQAMATKDGVKGCYDYWKKTLAEEKASFSIKQKDDKLELKITNCPSIRTLSTPLCKEYCRHCAIIYDEILSPLGLKYYHKKRGNGQCELTVEKETK